MGPGFLPSANDWFASESPASPPSLTKSGFIERSSSLNFSNHISRLEFCSNAALRFSDICFAVIEGSLSDGIGFFDWKARFPEL